MPRPKKEPAAQATVERVDVARLVAANGVTFFATFNQANKTVGVSIGRLFPERGEDQFVVSFPSARAFAKLINKNTRKA